MLFADIPAFNIFKSKLLHNREQIAHAQLFFDKEQGPALALAIAYAQWIMCQNASSDDACGSCISCVKLNKLSHPDLHFIFPHYINKEKDKQSIKDFIPLFKQSVIQNPYLSINEWINNADAETHQLKITADTCKQMVEEVYMKSYEGGYKIFIIWQPELAGKEANIWLKSLEEPTDNTLFLLVSYQPDSLLNTVVSRCRTWKVPPLTSVEAHEILKENSYEAASIENAILSANGNIGYLMKLINENEEEELQLNHITWLEHCLQNKMTEVCASMEVYAKMSKENQKLFYTKAMQQLAHWHYLFQYNNDSIPQCFTNWDLRTWTKANNILEKAYRNIQGNANAKMLWIDTSIQIKNLL